MIQSLEERKSFLKKKLKKQSISLSYGSDISLFIANSPVDWTDQILLLIYLLSEKDAEKKGFVLFFFWALWEVYALEIQEILDTNC